MSDQKNYMMYGLSREKVLARIRNALAGISKDTSRHVNLSAPVLKPLVDTPDVAFARAFTETGGSFVYCGSIKEFQVKLIGLMEERSWQSVYCRDKTLQALLKDLKIPYTYSDKGLQGSAAAITRCEYLVARFGSVMVSSGTGSGRKAHVYPDTHLVFAFTSQIVQEIKDAFINIQQKYKRAIPSMVSFITGPSRTADIEKTLVMGAHGPGELILFLVES
ncbi:MAG: LUD domain-containing protein [Bacteroidales bacterium]